MHRFFAVAIAVSAPLFAADCRVMLADQSNWNGKTGYYLSLENQSAGSAPCVLSTLNIALGTADGNQWRFVVKTPAWQLGTEYTATAVIGPGSGTLSLNGMLLGSTGGGFIPDPGQQTISAGTVPGWANGTGDYYVAETALSLTTAGGASAGIPFDAPAAFTPLMMLGSTAGKSAAWAVSAGDTITIAVRFKFLARPSPRAFDPWIDSFGQLRYADWPGKTRSVADLAAAAQEEAGLLTAWGVPAGFDAYGGLLNAGWKESPTGFFRVVQHRGMWWLISPLGNPCFYIGVCTAPSLNWDRTPVTGRTSMFKWLPPKSGDYAAAWGINSWGQTDGTEDVAFHAANLIRKHGDNWQDKATAITVQRLRAWGFSGFGKWSSDAGGLPILPVLSRGAVPNLVSHPDIFDAAIQARFRQALSDQVTPRMTDPLVVGWSVGNEYDEIITAAETASVLKTSRTPAKRALVDQALQAIYGGNLATMSAAWGVKAASVDDLYAAAPTAPAADVETLRRFYERQYHGFLYRTVKDLDPNHLYLGFWIVPGWWENEEDWRIAAESCDVIGYDYYSPQFFNPQWDQLIRQTNKPVLLGEFGFPSVYGFQRGFSAFSPVQATDDAGAGAMYARWLDAARQHPNLIGLAWFQYRNEPVCGRGPGHGAELVYGENYACGLADVADRPKYELVEKVRAANLVAAGERAALSAAPLLAPPAVNDGGVVSTAGYTAAAPVAPGSLVSIFGTNLAVSSAAATLLPLTTSLAGSTVQMGSVTAPLLFASPLQLNVQVPWELAGQTQAVLRVSASLTAGNTAVVPLATYAPGIFLVGAKQGAIIIANTASVAAPAGTFPGSRPVKRGEYISIYCTGLGPVRNQPATGDPAPLQPLATTLETPEIAIGGVPQTPSFSGLAPGFAGLYQMNARVPDTVTPGSEVPVSISTGGAASNTVTIAVE